MGLILRRTAKLNYDLSQRAAARSWFITRLRILITRIDLRRMLKFGRARCGSEFPRLINLHIGRRDRGLNSTARTSRHAVLNFDCTGQGMPQDEI